MVKRLNIRRKETETEEYIVENKKGDTLGQIAYWKVRGHKKKDWWFFVYWNPMDSDRDFWMGEDCLREAADFLKELKQEGNSSQP